MTHYCSIKVHLGIVACYFKRNTQKSSLFWQKTCKRLNQLPEWDGRDRVRELFQRLPGVTEEQIAQRQRKRYASFVATTNNPRPLQDTTGSRRYLCVEIPQDTIILNDREIEYDQLYAQVVYEVCQQKLPYWFTPAETRRIEEMNVKFQHVSDLESMLTACFRRPVAGEFVIPLLTRDVVYILCKNFPELRPTQGMAVKVGRMLKALNFEQKDLMQGSAYFIVPVKSAA